MMWSLFVLVPLLHQPTLDDLPQLQLIPQPIWDTRGVCSPNRARWNQVRWEYTEMAQIWGADTNWLYWRERIWDVIDDATNTALPDDLRNKKMQRLHELLGAYNYYWGALP